MREDGYYWVKYRGSWIVAECTFGKFWWIPGDEFQANESDFEEIDEKRLERGDNDTNINQYEPEPESEGPTDFIEYNN